MIALRMYGEMSPKRTSTRLWLLVRTPRLWPCASRSTEFFAARYSLRFSRSGRSDATAIIIPKTVETIASSVSGRKIASSRSFFIRGRTGGGPGGGSWSPNNGVMLDPVSTLMRRVCKRPRGPLGGRSRRRRGASRRRSTLALAGDGIGSARRRVPGPQRGRVAACRRAPGPAGGRRARGSSAARQTRARPDGAGHPPRPHGRPAEAARVPGPRASRGPDRRGLHRAGRRSERAHRHAAGTVGRGDRRQRAHLPGAGLPRPARRPGAARGALQLQVAGHEHGGALPAGPHDDGRPAARARRLRQALVAVRSDVELGGTDQTFNLLLARDIQRAFGQPEQAVLTMPILPGTDGVEKMSKSVGNHIGITEPPGEMYGRTLSVPDEAMDTWFSLLAVERPPSGTSPRDAKHALARALVARFHGEDAAEAAASEFERVHVQRSAPEEIEELAFEAVDGVVHLPALIAAGFGMSRSDARRMLAQGGVRLDGEALGADDLDLPRDRVDGAVLQVGKRHFRRVRVG